MRCENKINMWILQIISPQMCFCLRASSHDNGNFYFSLERPSIGTRNLIFSCKRPSIGTNVSQHGLPSISSTLNSNAGAHKKWAAKGFAQSKGSNILQAVFFLLHLQCFFARRARSMPPRRAKTASQRAEIST